MKDLDPLIAVLGVRLRGAALDEGRVAAFGPWGLLKPRLEFSEDFRAYGIPKRKRQTLHANGSQALVITIKAAFLHAHGLNRGYGAAGRER